MTDKPYVEVRALVRGIALLNELNRLGAARAAVLSKAAKIDRTTTYRLLSTLERLGLVAQRASDDAFVLTSQVRSLSDGYVERDHLTRTVSRHLGALFQQVLWPNDFATFDRDTMVIRETTHRFSPYSIHRNMIGRSRPLLGSALGRAYLAGASPAQLEIVSAIAKQSSPERLGVASTAHVDDIVKRLREDFDRKGYAWSEGGTEQGVSAIALPILGAEGALGAINLIFFRSVMTPVQAADRHLAALRACVDDIEHAMRSEDMGAG